MPLPTRIKGERIPDKWMVVFGTPFGDGLLAYGTFETPDDAVMWAQQGPQNEQWDVVQLYAPEER